uniref:Galectin n=1 Tax=Meloidogyne javanica TaxID=6303 RepID=A0A915LRE3_MELJA
MTVDEEEKKQINEAFPNENKKVLPGGRPIGINFTQKYDTITFVLPNELAESMGVYIEPNTGLYKYKENNKFSIYVSKSIVNFTSDIEFSTFFELDLVNNVVKINLKEPKVLKVILYNPLEFNCPQRYFSFKFGKIENLLPTMLSCDNQPGWAFPIKDGEIFYTGEITNLNIKCDEAIHVKNINLYYINFEIDADGNIKAICSLVGFNSKGEFNDKFVNLLKMITKPTSTTKHIEGGSASKSPDLDIPDAKRMRKEHKPRKP